ncbi:HD domain-containing protein [Nocardia fluminea]|uniref:Cyanamide hydratase family protein with HD domain n=1 Tax=Nocardia fluminea TaxID=134984 RepID=A0A2N3WX41_9NOCA|nr:HD domain-containing protein [Nocardia fluminea]PKV98461.1 cyanamide hydratase family protein with HD domain [Nocardia fluminea]
MKRDGELGRLRQIRTAGAALGIQTLALPHLVRGLRRGGEGSGGAAPMPPDSRLCRSALEEATEMLSPALLAHSLRCWEFGTALARVDDLAPDPEALYLACVLHDIGVGAPDDATTGCFALLGAHRARAFVVERGATVELGECVHTAIARHMDPRTPREHGAEAALLHDAAHLDVVGLRAHQLAPGRIAEIHARHGREGFSSEFAAAMRAEARVRPRSTAATLWRSGMPIAIALNPLDR